MNLVVAQNYAEMLVDGHRLLPVLLADLRQAERAIHVSMFLFFRDPIGEEIADVLIEKARQGVAVRVLVNVEKTGMGDPFSTGEKQMMRHDPNVHHDPTDVKPLCDRMRAGGVEVVDTNIDFDAEVHTSDSRLRSIAAQIAETSDIDDLHIDHRKIVVIDGWLAYCGGANVGAQYLFHEPFDPARDAREEAESRKQAGGREPWWKWHDSLTRFDGPIAEQLDAQFRERWVLDGGRDFAPIVGGSLARPPRPVLGVPVAGASIHRNAPDASPNQVRELYVRLIAEAERSIFVENPYFYHPAVVEALVEAKRRRPSLRVDLVLPARAWNDNEFAHDAQQYHYAAYLEAGIAVYEYQNHFNHLKVAVFDERWSIHGSTNLNFRSLEDDKDFELVVLVDSEPLARQVLERVRDVDIEHARRFSLEQVTGSLSGQLRVQTRDPRTLLLLSRKVL